MPTQESAQDAEEVFDHSPIGYNYKDGGDEMRGDSLVWTIVGVLAIIALCIFIF